MLYVGVITGNNKIRFRTICFCLEHKIVNTRTVMTVVVMLFKCLQVVVCRIVRPRGQISLSLSIYLVLVVHISEVRGQTLRWFYVPKK